MAQQNAELRVDDYVPSAPGSTRWRQDAADPAAAESARMLADLNDAADNAAWEAAARVAADMHDLLDGDLRCSLHKSSGTDAHAWASSRSRPPKPGARSRRGGLKSRWRDSASD